MKQQSGTQSNAKFLPRLEACSLLALRAAAQGARQVHQAAAQSAAARRRTPMLRRDAGQEMRHFSGDRSAAKVGPKLLNTERRPPSRRLQAQKQNTRKHLSVVVALPTNCKSNLACGFSSLRGTVGRVLANQSLNRTLCGGPRLAIISFLAKHGPPQSAG